MDVSERANLRNLFWGFVLRRSSSSVPFYSSARHAIALRRLCGGRLSLGSHTSKAPGHVSGRPPLRCCARARAARAPLIHAPWAAQSHRAPTPHSCKSLRGKCLTWGAASAKGVTQRPSSYCGAFAQRFMMARQCSQSCHREARSLVAHVRDRRAANALSMAIVDRLLAVSMISDIVPHHPVCSSRSCNPNQKPWTGRETGPCRIAPPRDGNYPGFPRRCCLSSAVSQQ